MLQIFGNRGTKTRGQPENPENDVAQMLESPEPKVSAESIVREYSERIAQALETERDRLKSQAEQNSSQIIAQAEEQSRSIIEAAQQKAQQILTAAKNQATEDGARKIAEAQQQAEQLIRDADRRAEEKAKEKTKHEVESIIARTKEEADRAVSIAKEVSKIESDKIIVESRKEAERLLVESREEACLEARQEWTRVISETRENAAQIMTEVIEQSRAQAKSALVRAASDAKSKMESEMSGLVTQVTRSIEQIAGETELTIQTELEHVATLIAEAGKKLQPVTDIVDKQTVTAAGQITATAEDEKTKATVESNGDKRKVLAKEKSDTRLYKGNLNLAVAPPFDRAQLESVKRYLSQVPGLKLLSTGGYAEGDRSMMIYTIDLEYPTPLLKLLKAMPPVGDVAQQKGGIAITLNR